MKLYDKILALILIQLAAVFIFGIHQIQSLYETQKKAFDEKTLLQSDIVQKRFEEMLTHLQKTADILTNSQEVITGLIGNDTDMLYNWSKLFLSSNIDKIHFMDLDGIVISRGEEEFRFSDDVFKTFSFDQALHNDAFLGIDLIDTHECLVYAKRIKQYGETPIGVISVALIIDEDLLRTLVEGTTMQMTYTSKHQTLSTARDTPLIHASALSMLLPADTTPEAAFRIGLTSAKELTAIKEARMSFFIAIALAFVVLLLTLHVTLLKHLKEHESLTRLLIDFYEDRIDIKEVIRQTKQAIQMHSAPEIKKIAEALFNMSQKVADTQDALESLSTTDQLTSLYNRRKLEETLEQKLKEASRTGAFSVVMLDLDHFKHINDTYGHDIGDHVLINVAHVLKEAIRASDIIGRWGGEEFLLIFPQTEREGALVIAEQLREKLQNVIFEKYPHSISGSFGVSTYRENDTQHTVLRRADLALYRAKNNGRNRIEHED
jgi:diguanylate cyclase (GGDEF)-like protein